MELIKNEYIPLYFYSAIFQGNMALLGITAVFAIFKLQSLTQQATELYIQMRDRVVKPALKQITEGELVKYLQSVNNGISLVAILSSWRDDTSDGYQQKFLKSHATSLLADKEFFDLSVKEKTKRDLRNKYVEELVSPLYWTVGMSIGSLVMLLVGFDLHSWNRTLSLFVMLASIGCQYWTLRKIVKYGLLTLVDEGDNKR